VTVTKSYELAVGEKSSLTHTESTKFYFELRGVNHYDDKPFLWVFNDKEADRLIETINSLRGTKEHETNDTTNSIY